MKRLIGSLPSVLALALWVVDAPLAAEPAAAPQAQPAADDWPRTRESPLGKLSLYPPDVDEWDGYVVTGHAACSVEAKGSDHPVFGVVELTASTRVDRAARTVALDDVKVTKASFPAAPSRAAEYQAAFQELAPKAIATLPLDRVEAALAVEGSARKAKEQAVRNDPPAIVFSKTAAALVLIDGEPVWRPVKGTNLERVLDTRALVLREPPGKVFVHVLDGWMEAPGLGGPWTVASSVPGDAERVAKWLGDAGVVDLMTGPVDEWSRSRPTLKNGAPQIIVANRPTEVIVTAGEPSWGPIPGTKLLYVTNTNGNVFKDTGDQKTYVLVSGRWFRSGSVAGPWAFVEGKELPADFARIPDASPKENAKASVPGTPQAEEALVANQIPQMARVDRQKTSFVPRLEGDPVLRPIEGTLLSYVANSSTPIILVTPTEWYALENGVWFAAPALVGPWSVATSVPSLIYAIPTSSPLHYVTYVKIYDVQPSYVLFGYTPGYLGTVVAPGPVVVYGTGYWYPPYVGADAWFGWPYTYGFGLGLAWTPWTSWGYGFGFGWGWGAVSVGWGWGWGWGCAPWWGAYPWAPPYAGYGYGSRTAPAPPYGGYGARTAPAPQRTAAAWGPGSWSATRSNVYQRWGTPAVSTRSSATYNPSIGSTWSGAFGHAYNSRTGAIAAGQRGNLVNVYRGTWAHGGPSRGAWGGGAWGGRQANPFYGGGARAGAAYGGYPGGARAGVPYGAHAGGAYRGAPPAGGSFHGAAPAGRASPAPAAGGGGGGARGSAPSGGGGHRR